MYMYKTIARNGKKIDKENALNEQFKVTMKLERVKETKLHIEMGSVF